MPTKVGDLDVREGQFRLCRQKVRVKHAVSARLLEFRELLVAFDEEVILDTLRGLPVSVRAPDHLLDDRPRRGTRRHQRTSESLQVTSSTIGGDRCDDA